MSSTNRGKTRNRKDNYPTPEWCVHRLLDAKPKFLDYGNLKNKGPIMLEPCAGDGAIIRAVQSHEVLTQQIWNGPAQWDAVEIRKGKKIRAALESLALTTPSHESIFKFLEAGGLAYDIALTNPPFSIAWEMLHALWPCCADICFLLRLNFFGSANRHEWMQKHQPDVYILPDRPRFGVNQDGKPGTDSIEYAWFHWDTRYITRKKGTHQLLDLTPLDVRQAAWEIQKKAA